MSEVTTTDVVVIGGGPAGLATAWRVAQDGRRVVLLERSDATGGMAASYEVNGQRVDAGSHRLHPATPEHLLRELRALLGDDLQLRRRNGRVLVAGQWLRFPLVAPDVARRMPLRWLVTVALEGILCALRTRPAPSSYADALRGSLGATAYDSLYEPFARKLWGLPGDAIDPEQARVRVSADSLVKVGMRVLRNTLATPGALGGHQSCQRVNETSVPVRNDSDQATDDAGEEPTPAPRGTTFWYPRNGFGSIVESIEHAARSAGADIQCGVHVTRIRPGALARVESADGRVWEAPTVLSTVPLSLLPQLVHPEPDTEMVAHAEELTARAMLLVYLTHRPPGPSVQGVRWTPFDAHYVPSEHTPITRISEPKNYRDNPDDPGDRSVICAEIPCTVGDVWWTSTDDALRDIVQQGIVASGLPPVAIDDVHVRRIRSAYPVYAHGYAEHVAALEQWASTLTGVTTLGRAGLFSHDNTHHSLIMAEAAASCIGPDGAIDSAAWAAAREEFRHHVVED